MRCVPAGDGGVLAKDAGVLARLGYAHIEEAVVGAAAGHVRLPTGGAAMSREREQLVDVITRQVMAALQKGASAPLSAAPASRSEAAHPPAPLPIGSGGHHPV